jgi:hypothetical protein
MQSYYLSSHYPNQQQNEYSYNIGLDGAKGTFGAGMMPMNYGNN